jgi:nucleoid-associated protein YgaU
VATKSQTKNKKVDTTEAAPEKKSSFAENYGSTILGFVVVLILGSFLFNVFRGNQNGEVGSGEETTQDTTPTSAQGRTHTVARGDDLWKISEKYYGTGYNWTDIAEANNITNANEIAEGQQLVIPNVSPKAPTATVQPTTQASATNPESAPTTPTATTTTQPTTAAKPTTPAATPAQGEKGGATGGSSYTVAKGDSLWTIAVKEYNDGYKWAEIARANKLGNPDVIHVGNTLTLPR